MWIDLNWLHQLEIIVYLEMIFDGIAFEIIGFYCVVIRGGVLEKDYC